MGEVIEVGVRVLVVVVVGNVEVEVEVVVVEMTVVISGNSSRCTYRRRSSAGDVNQENARQ